jgi:hypothetical protein
VDDFQKAFDVMESAACGKVILNWNKSRSGKGRVWLGFHDPVFHPADQLGKEFVNQHTGFAYGSQNHLVTTF